MSEGSPAAERTRRTIHVSAVRDYPAVAPLPLPANIDPNETIQFSPYRARDIGHHTVSLAAASSSASASYHTGHISSCTDPHVASYDAQGSVNLNCAMQSNVPEPFSGHNFVHLNMPGGAWAQNGKFMAQDLQASHYTNLRQQVRSEWDKKKGGFGSHSGIIARPFHCYAAAAAVATTNPGPLVILSAAPYSTKELGDGSSGGDGPSPVAESKKTRLQRAFKEYGSTVICFHVGISLASLGMFYAMVSRYVIQGRQCTPILATIA